MNAEDETQREAVGESGSPESNEAEDETMHRRRPPKLNRYLALNLAVWAYLAFQAWVLIMLLGRATAIVFLSLALALGFLAASLFDWLWLHLGREKGKR